MVNSDRKDDTITTKIEEKWKEEDKEMKREKKSNVILVPGHIIHSFVPQICQLYMPRYLKKCHIGFFY
jgi:hypothetical protein